MRLNREEALAETKEKPVKKPILSQQEIFAIRKEILSVHMESSVEEYIVQIVMATRNPGKYNDKLKNLIEYGASPRASIYLDRGSRALAWLLGRDFVIPSDISQIAHEILRHRIGLSFEAESMNYGADQVIDDILEAVALP